MWVYCIKCHGDVYCVYVCMCVCVCVILCVCGVCTNIVFVYGSPYQVHQSISSVDSQMQGLVQSAFGIHTYISDASRIIFSSCPSPVS